MLAFKNYIHHSPRRLSGAMGGQTPAFEYKMLVTANPWGVQMLGGCWQLCHHGVASASWCWRSPSPGRGLQLRHSEPAVPEGPEEKNRSSDEKVGVNGSSGWRQQQGSSDTQTQMKWAFTIAGQQTHTHTECSRHSHFSLYNWVMLQHQQWQQLIFHHVGSFTATLPLQWAWNCS